MLDPRIREITDRIIARSARSRRRYLDLMDEQKRSGVERVRLSCGNLAHGFAASGCDKDALRSGGAPNIGIITSYNDVLSAHQPYGRYPEAIKLYAREVGATAQVAGGVPAMCDGVTQGQIGMELSLFSRDVIALSTTIALSHGLFDGVALLGICDKIVPGLLIGALRFGHLPAIFVPSGPMATGIPNPEKQRVRKLYSDGRAARADLLEVEAASYHSPGTCTFYGTANSNQIMMEVMGLHVPGAAFVPPGTPLRSQLTRAAIHRLVASCLAKETAPLASIVDERALVNAAVALLATGGSTNHAIHLPAIARAAGVLFNWDDLAALSECVPLIARIYPNGAHDINAFEASGGIAFLMRELLYAGLLHQDAISIWPTGMTAYTKRPRLKDDGQLEWREPPATDSLHGSVLRPVRDPFQTNGGMCLVSGNLGRAIFKTSAVDPSHWTTEAPAAVFSTQEDVEAAFKLGELWRDVAVVLCFQGPRACGMPELHKLTPILSLIQDKGHRVCLVTDGRMSGASGSVPAAIHLSPEAQLGGPISKVRDGDIVRLCARTGTIQLMVSQEELASRGYSECQDRSTGTGRELFAVFRHGASNPEEGASILFGCV